MSSEKNKISTDAITIDPEIMSGAPVFKGTRVTIQTMFDYLEDGYTLDEFLESFDWVKKEDALAVLELDKMFARTGY
jgi:uncharacterized protein (DUF433 family)